MPRKTKQRLEKHWTLSEDMRAWFIEKGWDTNNQFLIDKMMDADEVLSKHPLPGTEGWHQMLRENEERRNSSPASSDNPV